MHFIKHIERERGEPTYDRVYGSAIFAFSADRVAQFREHFPDAIVGGTHNVLDNITVEQVLGVEVYEHYDYWIYRASFAASIGLTQRGCRLNYPFASFRRRKANRARSIPSPTSGLGRPIRSICICSTTIFFGQPRDQWRARIAEIKAGGFKVCLSQGVNIRTIDDEAAGDVERMA